MNRHNERAAASYDMPLSDSKLFVLNACQSDNKYIRMRQPFSYLSLRTLLRQKKVSLCARISCLKSRVLRDEGKYLFARVSHD